MTNCKKKEKPTAKKKTLMGDGTQVEQHITDGMHHKESGPAWVIKSPCGLKIEFYLRNGVLSREDGPAVVIDNGKGDTVKEWIRDGQHNPPTP